MIIAILRQVNKLGGVKIWGTRYIVLNNVNTDSFKLHNVALVHIVLKTGSPSTDTVKLQVAVFPLVSIAVNITIVSLNGNWVPDW